jgi:hypothetical protein
LLDSPGVAAFDELMMRSELLEERKSVSASDMFQVRESPNKLHMQRRKLKEAGEEAAKLRESVWIYSH